MNVYLEPFVEDMERAYKGIQMSYNHEDAELGISKGTTPLLNPSCITAGCLINSIPTNCMIYARQSFLDDIF
jgi:hypothetical protein